MSEAIDWLQPAPLWDLDGRAFQDFLTPALLEFGDDDFMETFFAAARAASGDRLRGLVLAQQGSAVLKLYQPAHGRYYLVCCSLCCRIPGFPDRVVRGENDERVFFVMRRLVGEDEYAWAGPEDSQRWRKVSGDGRTILADEERLPMAETAGGGGRSLFFGYLPVASGATYKLPAPRPDDKGPADVPDAVTAAEFPDTRVEELGSRFTQPITGTLDANGKPLPGTPVITSIDDRRARAVSVYLLLEGWEWFAEHMSDLAGVLRGDAGAALRATNKGARENLLKHLKSITLAPGLDLAAALGAAAKKRADLNKEGGVEEDEDLGDLGFDNRFNLKPIAGTLREPLAKLPDLARLALKGEPPPDLVLPKLSPRDDHVYVLRCAYARPLCDEVPLVVSRPSLPFRLATFFDPEAPARTVRIPLPADVSIAGLRKAKKNVSFMISNAMRRKMDSLAGREKELLKGESPNPEDSLDLAFICSFSIQIIFIVAFMLLLIFVILLNIVFWWVAFFRICLPIPNSLAPK